MPRSPSTVQLTQQLVAAHEGAVWRYLRYLGCDPELATELAQDTFLVLMNARLEDRGPQALHGWLRGTAKNLVRARRRRIRPELTGVSDDVMDQAWLDHEREDDGAGYRAALQSCLEALPPRQRHAVDLRWREGRDLRGVAAALDLSREGAKTLLRRIKTQLKQCIGSKIQ